MDETQVLPDVYLNETYVEAAQLPRYDGEETPQADLYCEGVPPLPLMFGARCGAPRALAPRPAFKGARVPRGAHRRVSALR